MKIEDGKPDFDTPCSVCGKTPTVAPTELCGVCCFGEANMEKKIVTIDVGSEIVSTIDTTIAKNIDQEIQIVTGYNKHQVAHTFDFYFLLNHYKTIKSINGIPVSEIEEVRIAGYDDKVTLRVGDILSSSPYAVLNDDFKVTLISKDLEIRRAYVNGGTFLAWANYWYVNGKRYHRDDIIIADQSVNFDEIANRPFIQKSMDMAKAASDLEPVKIGNHVVEQQEEFEEITPENWNEVWHRSKQDVTVSSCITTINKGGGNWCAELNHEQIKTKYFAEFLAFVQKRISLKPLPKFDFRQYLLDNEFRNQTSEYDFGSYGVAITLNSSGFRFKNRDDYYSQTKENADILIEMAKLAKELK